MDEILRTRLAEVKRTLERASLARLRSLEDSRAVVTDPSMRYSMAISVPTLEEAVLPFMPNRWGDLEIQFGAESKDLHEKIEALEKRYEGLAAIKDDERQRKELSQLWQVYTDLEKKCESLVGEIVELMGGLALRDKGVAPWLFAVADHLVKWYSRRAVDSWAVTVPSVRGAIARTLSSMIGLRFLEWSVWAMPLTGFEFARQSKGRYQATIKGRIEEALPGVWEGQQVPEPDVLYADAFATCMTGPAYLLAAIHLRLSIEETARAVVIFRVLRGLDKDETLGKDFLDGFRTGWQSSPASGDSLPAEEVEKLERFADAALAALRIFHMGAVYSVDQDWSNAKSISNGWRDAAETPEGELGLPDHLRVITPADVLNAAWYCRIKQFVDIPRLERAVRNYFERPAPAGPSSRMQQPPIG